MCLFLSHRCVVGIDHPGHALIFVPIVRMQQMSHCCLHLRMVFAHPPVVKVHSERHMQYIVSNLMESIISLAWSWSSSAPLILPLPNTKGLNDKSVKKYSKPVCSPFVGERLGASDAQQCQLLADHLGSVSGFLQN